ncbi:uncharacterized protein LOC118910803 isoform X1 [Manis pentadactyla]|uniref:uncharacterized protein LOC118910803 isoform X1 n=1 Tax=Manis pentadactyla TaxID=143292 RepID=UPI00255CE2D8|nr:uncharacterized protein LOC118910803 isoform X1 [Manis pentadactyla]
MELTKAGILISSLTSKILSAAKLANVSTVASNSVLAGLSSMGLTLSSNAALGQAASTLGSWLGALNGCSLLGAPAAALTSFPVGAKIATAVAGGGASLQERDLSPHLPPGSGTWGASTLAGAQGYPRPHADAVAVGAVPTVLGAMGFTSAGIAASSIAAKMMSVAAISNGGGVAAGSLVATLQSVGAAGLSMSSKVLLGSAGSALVSRMMGL